MLSKSVVPLVGNFLFHWVIVCRTRINKSLRPLFVFDLVKGPILTVTSLFQGTETFYHSEGGLSLFFLLLLLPGSTLVIKSL